MLKEGALVLQTYVGDFSIVAVNIMEGEILVKCKFV